MRREADNPQQRSAAEALQLIQQERALIKIMFSSIPFKHSDKPLDLDAYLSRIGSFLNLEKVALNLPVKSTASSASSKATSMFKKDVEKTTTDPWDTVTESLNEPGLHRRIKPIPTTNENAVDRTRYIDPRTLGNDPLQDPQTIEWIERKVNPVRGAPKPEGWEYTKKTSTSLLPHNGRMHYYASVERGEKDGVGLLFDIDLCHLKDGKYIWPQSGVTNWQWWLKSDASHPRKKSITLEELRQFLRSQVEQGIIPDHDEILACVSKKALKAIFATEDVLMHRLNALKTQMKLQRGLGIGLPLLVIDPEGSPRVYDINEQIADIKKAMQMNPDSRENLLLRDMLPNPQAFISAHELLAEAVKAERSEDAIKLLNEGASPDYKLDGRSLLELAILTNQKSVVFKMLNLPQLPTPTTMEAAMKLAQQKGDLEIVTVLKNKSSGQMSRETVSPANLKP